MTYSTLLSASQLHEQLESTVVIDCRFDLGKPAAGEQAYGNHHIPGARYAHLDRDLSGPITPATGRHPLPDPQTLAQTFGRWGIDSSRQVVAYDADTGMYAARLWWLLRWLGHEQVAVLDGGYKAWQAAGFPTSVEIPQPRTAKFVGHPHNESIVSAETVADVVQQSAWRVLDARAPERFRGEVEPIDPVAGHIPGARNHPFALNLQANSHFLPSGELAARYREALGDIAPNRVVAMCGSGVTACHTLLAMEVAGLRGAKLYAGSWSEWIRDPARAVAAGKGIGF